jgi:ABC-2 type transport system ATP-binding protein
MITATALTKTYGDVTAVDRLDLEVPAGQVLALLGPNGAGKSTTTEMMLGLAVPDAGTVTVAGRTPDEATRDGAVGAMLQNGALLPDVSVRNLLTLLRGIQAHPLPLDEVVERADIADLLRLNTSKLSGGQAQRVRFALALMADPEVLLLDEPTVGMDVETRRRFWDRMGRFADGGRTIVFATHYLDEADAFADRVVVLARGRVVADGTGAEIKQAAGGRTLAVTAAPDLLDRLIRLPGVRSGRAEGGRIHLACSDSDAAVRALVASDLPASDLEISTPRLEDAFVALTHA